MAMSRVFDEHLQVLNEAATLLPPVLEQVREAFERALFAGNKVLIFGNGGSAADAQHLATELVCRVRRDRRALPAIALTTDSSALTAIGNDHGFERIFARQVDALANPGDVCLAISTSGNSPNVLAAVHEGRARGCVIVALTGRGGGALAPLADLWIAAPSSNVSRIQEVHALCLHAIAEAIEEGLLAGGPS